MPDLHWLCGESDTPMFVKCPVRDGAKVRMAATQYSGGHLPSHLTLYRAYSPLVGSLLAVGKKDRYRFLQDVNVHPISDSGVHSDQTILRAGGVLQTHRWFFKDHLGNRSTMIRAMRFVRISVGGGAGLPHEIAKVSFDTELAAAVDPSVRLSIISPWTAGEPSIAEVLQAELDDFASDADPSLRAEISNHLEALLGNSMHPDVQHPWEASIPEDVITVEAEAVTSVPLSIGLTEPAAVAFAVVARTGGDELIACSDLFVVVYDGASIQLLFADDDTETVEGVRLPAMAG